MCVQRRELRGWIGRKAGFVLLWGVDFVGGSGCRWRVMRLLGSTEFGAGGVGAWGGV